MSKKSTVNAVLNGTHQQADKSYLSHLTKINKTLINQEANRTQRKARLLLAYERLTQHRNGGFVTL